MAEYQYDAFISYRHRPEDMAVARKLVQLLERMTGPEGRKLHVFRDREELPTEADLGSAIRKGLEDSRFLIVVCSPAYKESRWCMEELRYFRQLHGNSNAFILPILVEGEPEDVFPEELCWEERKQLDKDGREHTVRVELEPLGADVRAQNHLHRMGLLRREYLRLAAPMLGKTFDQLYQRSRRRKRWTMGIFLSLVIAGLTAFTLYNMNMLRRIEQEHMTMLSNESRRLALEAESSLAEGDHSLAMLLALEALPQDPEDPEKPLIPEAETALRSAVYSRQYAQRTSFLQPLATVSFDRYGWTLQGMFDGGNRIAVTDHDWLRFYDAATGMELQRYPSNHFSEANLNADGTLLAKCTREGQQGEVIHYRLEIYSLEEERLLFEEELSYAGYHGVYICWDLEKDICYFYDGNDKVDQIIFGVDSSGNKLEDISLPPETWEQMLYTYWDFHMGGVKILPMETAYYAREEKWSPLGKKYKHYIEDLWKDDYREAVVTEDEKLLIFFTVGPWDLSGEVAIYPLEALMQGFRKPIKLSGGCRVDCANQRIYLFEEYALKIYSYCPGNTVTAKMMGSNRFADLNMISSDGKLCLFETEMEGYGILDTSWKFSGNHWLRVFTCENLADPLVEMPHHGYYATPDLRHIFVKAEDQTFQLWHTEKGKILTLDIAPDRAAEVTNLCVSADGSLLALAWGEAGTVEVYSGKDGSMLRQIDVSVQEGMEAPEVTFLEFEGTDLLITLQEEYSTVVSRIVDITGKRPDVCIPDGSFERGIEMYVSDNVLTSDGLLLCGGDYINGALDAIYDIRTGECVFRNVAYCQYDERRGLLLYVLTDPYNGDSSVLHAAKRDEAGSFRDVYTVNLENGLNLRDNLWCMDENYVILSGNQLCRVYEIETGRCVLNLHVPDAMGPTGRFYVVNGCIYDLQYHHSDTVSCYPILDTSTLMEQAKAYLTSDFGTRHLTDGEKADYFIE